MSHTEISNTNPLPEESNDKHLAMALRQYGRVCPHCQSEVNIADRACPVCGAYKGTVRVDNAFIWLNVYGGFLLLVVLVLGSAREHGSFFQFLCALALAIAFFYLRKVYVWFFSVPRWLNRVGTRR